MTHRVFFNSTSFTFRDIDSAFKNVTAWREKGFEVDWRPDMQDDMWVGYVVRVAYPEDVMKWPSAGDAGYEYD